jgi:hypothetical protein
MNDQGNIIAEDVRVIAAVTAENVTVVIAVTAAAIKLTPENS